MFGYSTFDWQFPDWGVMFKIVSSFRLRKIENLLQCITSCIRLIKIGQIQMRIACFFKQ